MKSIRANVLLLLLGSILCSANVSYTGASPAEIAEHLPQIQEHCQQAMRTLRQHCDTAWQRIRPFMLYLILRAHEERLPLARQIYYLIHTEQQNADTAPSPEA